MIESRCYLYTGDAKAQVRNVTDIYCRASLLNCVSQMGPTQVPKAVAIFLVRRMQEIVFSIFKEEHKGEWSYTGVRNRWERVARESEQL
jgi:hypothetical protein